MKTFCFCSILLLSTFYSYGQKKIIFKVADSESKKAISFVSIAVNNKTIGITDSLGIIQLQLIPVKNIFHFSCVGYEEKEIKIDLSNISERLIYLIKVNHTLDDVTIISTTRNNQRIENSPLKVEVLGKEEMDEENTIKPGNIASILGDVSGIQIQQSSAISGNANVRIQGLDGRYTQILKDGMPLFDGFSGGFGILQIPPLDLKQIELIKGSASTLYGGGAIGGLINLISKKPTYNQDLSITLNSSTLKENNFNIWASKRNKNLGYTFFSGYTLQKEFDVDKDGFSDVAKNNAFIIHPKLFFYPTKNTSVSVGYTGSFEKRIGGDMLVINNQPSAIHQYFEENKNDRNTGEFNIETNLSNRKKLDFKSSISSFKRNITNNTTYFGGRQINYFSELSLLIPNEKNIWVIGINALGDEFKKLSTTSSFLTNFKNNTFGSFVQATYNLPMQSTIEAGIRYDNHNQYGNFILPRVALFKRFDEHWAIRAGVGAGYKTPNPLMVQNTDFSIEKIHPLPINIKAEKSMGYNAEINYKINWDGNELFINQAFFLTKINSPVIANISSTQEVTFSNANNPIITKGLDTYIKLKLDDWEIYSGYTFTIAERKYLSQNQFVPLTPKNRFAFTLVNEIEGKWRFGLEGSYTGKQFRDDYTQTKGYFFAAAMVEKKLGKTMSLVLNCENIFDFRQSKFESLYTGSISNPSFKPLWAPIDGRVINFSILYKPFAKQLKN